MCNNGLDTDKQGRRVSFTTPWNIILFWIVFTCVCMCVRACVCGSTDHSTVGVSQQDSMSIQQGAMAATLGRLTERHWQEGDWKKRSYKRQKVTERQNGTKQLTEISNSTDRKITKTDADRKREGEACCIISFNKNALSSSRKMLETYN